jgi:arylformamidase
MNIYDISVPLNKDLPVYPGDPQLLIEPALLIEKGDGSNVTRICMSSHCGTHIDAPRHFDNRGLPVDRMPLQLLTGRALVAEVAGTKRIGRKELEHLPIKGEERLLLKTENSLLWSRSGFVEDYVSLTEEAAEYLAGIGVRLVGIDYLSIEAFNGNGEVHRKLLDHGVIILEGLNLDGVTKGIYELICLPLKLEGGDGAPARAILRRKEDAARQGETDIHSTRWPLA